MKKIILTIIHFLFLPFVVYSQDCDRFAEMAYNNLNISYTSNRTQDTKNWFCSERFFSDIEKRGLGGNITVPIYGVPVSFSPKANSENALSERQRFCSNAESFFSEDYSLSIVSQTVNIEVYDKFLECKRLTDRISFEKYESGETITLTLKFNLKSDADRNVHPKIRNWIVNGGRLSNTTTWPIGSEITISGISASITRVNPYEPVKVTVYTDIGSFSTIIKGKEYPKSVGRLQVQYSILEEKDGEPVVCSHQFGPSPDRHEMLEYEHSEPNTYQLGCQNVFLGKGRINNVTVACTGGDCRGWHREGPRQVIENIRRIIITMYTWSRPQYFTITAEWIPRISEVLYKNSSEYQLSRSSTFYVYVPKESKSIQVNLNVNDGEVNYNKSFYPVDFSTGSANSLTDRWVMYKGYSIVDDNYKLFFEVKSKP